jgi:hypothetical protein
MAEIAKRVTTKPTVHPLLSIHLLRFMSKQGLTRL